MKNKNKTHTNKSLAGANNNKNNQMNKGSMNINTNHSAEFANENPYSAYSSSAKSIGSVSKANPNKNGDAVHIRGSRSDAYSTEFSNEMANELKKQKTENVNISKTTGMADMVGTMGTINAGTNQMEAAEDSGLIDTMKKTSKKVMNKAGEIMGMEKKSKNDFSTEFANDGMPSSNMANGALSSSNSKMNKRKNEFQKNLKQNYNIEVDSE